MELMDKSIIQPAVILSDDWKAAAAAVQQRCSSVSTIAAPGVSEVQAYLDSVLVLPRLSGMDRAPPSTSLGASLSGGEGGEEETLEDTDAYLELFHLALGDMPAAQHLLVIAAIAEVRERKLRRILLITISLQGMSGRTLRKLPIKAHSFFLQRPAVRSSTGHSFQSCS